MIEPLLGRSINRLEDEHFVQGRGRYIADLAVPNALDGVVVRRSKKRPLIVCGLLTILGNQRLGIWLLVQF
jgi:CO/xanthine dehydrogenase Mo-binding subunit